MKTIRILSSPIWFLLLASGLQVFSPSSALAADKYWDGSDGVWTSSSNWRTADGGGGSVTTAPVAADNPYINAGSVTIVGSATTVAPVLGSVAGSSGTVSVSGLWRNTASVYVGGSGSGFLHIQSGGTMIGAAVGIARYAGSSGTAVVEGLWQNTGQMYVGYTGVGVLEITESGIVVDTTGAVGNVAGSSGTAFVAGLWQNNALVVGSSGTGFVEIAQTGTVTNVNGAIANAAGSFGRVYVDGLWASTGSLYVGAADVGTLDIRVTGSVTATGIITIGKASTGSGTATIAGYMSSGSTLLVGEVGAGFLDIASTGTVTSTGNAILGNDAVSSGTAFVSGLWQTDASLYVGGSGAGFLRVETGGVVKDSSAAIARFAGSSGTAVVGGLWQNTAFLYVGYTGVGVLDITESGTVTSPTGYIGHVAGSSGTLFVAGLWQTDNIRVGNAGDGALDIAATGTVSAAISSIIGYNNGSRGSATVAGLWVTSSNFVVGFNATSTGTLTLKPTGSVAISGYYRQNDLSTLQVELQPGRDTAYITAATATLGGTLAVTGFTGTFTGTKAGDITSTNAALIRTTDGIAGDFSAITLNGASVTAGDLGLSSVDYITTSLSVSNGNKDYTLYSGLSWLAPSHISHGTFTIGAGDTFDVDANLTNAPAGINGNTWDGRSLTKLGDGLLILSALNTHTGTTAVNGGTLRITGTTSGGAMGVIGDTAGSAGAVVVEGLWQNTSSVYVGGSGAGFLHIESGGTVLGNAVGIARYAGSSGTALVAGLWQNSNAFVVGSGGTAFVEIAQTGTVTNANAAIANAVGSFGRVYVDGVWASTGSLYVGTSDVGTLDIRATGSVTAAGIITIGKVATGSGTATVAGYMRSGSSLLVGEAGAGFLDIASTGTVANVSGNIGSAGGSGMAFVAGLWNNSSDFNVGNSGAGFLDILPTGSVTAAGMISIGKTATGSGTATVAGYMGSGSSLVVGELGAGFLRVKGSGTVAASGVIHLGSEAAGSGTIEVESGGYIGTTNTFIAGVYGTGYLHVAQSGSLMNSAAGAIGRYAGSSGTAFIEGLWKADAQLYLGYTGDGFLEIAATGTVLSNGTGLSTTLHSYIAHAAGASGTAIVAGLWQNAGHVLVGSVGNGWLDIKSTGTVTNNVGAIANTAGSFGRAYVEGVWANTGSLYVGASGIGALDIRASGTVTAGGIITIGKNATGSGTATVAGYMSSGSTLLVGELGAGFLDIASTGTVTSTANAILGNDAVSSGTAFVNGLWQTNASLYVGGSGAGFLRVESGGIVKDSAAAIARFAGSSGTAVVQGRWENASFLYVGYTGVGVLDITESGTVTSPTGYIGHVAGSSGTTFVAGLWQADNIRIGNAGDGVLDIKETGTVSAAISSIISYNDGSRGRATVAGLWVTSSNFVVGYNATSTGTLAIKPSGSVAIGGYYRQNDLSTLQVELQPGRETAYVTAATATLGGTLSLSGYNGIILASGTKVSELVNDSVLILSATGGISGDFTSISAPGATHPDYFVSGGFILNDNTEYRAGYGLAWNASAAVAHGTFTVDAGRIFDVDTLLSDRGGITTGWDGTSLAKNGGGTLILSAENAFTGPVTVNAGAIRLNGSANPRLGALHLNGGEIDFGGPSNFVIGAPPGSVIMPAYDGYRTLTVASLHGSGDIRMKIDLGAGKNDRLVIEGDATGAHRLVINPADGPAPIGDEPALTLVTIGGVNASSFESTTFTGGFDYGPFNYVLEQQDNEMVIVNRGLSTAYAPMRGVPGAQSLVWFGQQDNIGKRLGELRAADRDDSRWDAWARAHGSQSDLDATGDMHASKFTLWGVEIGADRTWRVADDRVILGLYAGYGSGSQDFTLDMAGASATGGSDLFGAGLYAAWLGNRGWFASASLSAARYKNNFDVADQSDNHNTARYNDTAYGVSVEAGRRIALGDAAGGWFMEPSAQVSYLRIARSDYITKGASPLSVHNVDSLLTRLRAAIRAGRGWQACEGGFLEIAGRLAIMHETSSGGEVRIGSETWRPNLDGNRGEAGVSLIWRARRDCQLCLDYEAAYGNNYKKPWDISLGIRLMF